MSLDCFSANGGVCAVGAVYDRRAVVVYSLRPHEAISPGAEQREKTRQAKDQDGEMTATNLHVVRRGGVVSEQVVAA
eukprot:COSAG02_NODE_2527_length_8604_cov_4.945209_2_plen_77_part_00